MVYGNGMVSKLYVNGDSHSAGAELDNDFCFASDDPNFGNWFLYHTHREEILRLYGKMPHYDNLWDSYGGNLSRLMNKPLICDAISGSSNDRILRTTKKYIEENRDVVVVIGWSTWERTEILKNDVYYQASASGNDSLPKEIMPLYKEWIANMTQEKLIEYEIEAHRIIYDFHKYLQSHNIKHLFFNTFTSFTNIPEQEQYDWDDCYLQPYDQDYTFYHYLKNKGYEPNINYHHDKLAHREWAKLLFDKIRFMM